MIDIEDVRREANMLRIEDFTTSSGQTTFEIKRSVKPLEIITVKKNEVEISDWTFDGDKTVTVTSVSEGDKIKIVAGTHATSREVNDAIDSAEAELVSSLFSFYSSPQDSPYFEEMVKKLAASNLILKYHPGKDDTFFNYGRHLLNSVNTFVKNIANGTVRLLDEDGNELTRTSLIDTDMVNLVDFDTFEDLYDTDD